jgi:lipid-A-disaccharide synthase-like uncharacterized protein
MIPKYWLWLGMFGQLMFFTRFIIQWVISEKKKESVIPVSFWYFSLFGSVILLAYSIYRKDPVFIAGMSAGLVIYSRNLILISRKRGSISAPEPGN